MLDDSGEPTIGVTKHPSVLLRVVRLEGEHRRPRFLSIVSLNQLAEARA
jgi:hypothetical protein